MDFDGFPNEKKACPVVFFPVKPMQLYEDLW